ncbi:MAG: hypothetical protein K6G90_03370 [Clostridia bacterium]|nr:hypothetical protein [Clostridia bacterium]
MKKSIPLRIFIVFFILVCALPAALAPVLRAGSTKEQLSRFPAFIEDGKYNFEFFREFDTWFSEHFALRAQLVTARSKILAKVLHTSSDADVILGSDGMLYYTPTADDYLHTEMLSDTAIRNVAHNIRLLNAWCDANGADFVFTMAPDKPTIYPESMPKNYIPASTPNNTERLKAELEGDGIYCDLIATLQAVKESITEPVYYKTDSHWNAIGAMAARNALVNMLPDNGRRDIFDSVTWDKRPDHEGDLAQMLYPGDVPPDYAYYPDCDFTYTTQGAYMGLDDYIIDTVCDGVNGALLMFRDSFGEALIPFMAETFGKAQFSRLLPYDLTAAGDYDAVVIEMGERNLPRFYEQAPRIPAPEAVPPSDAVEPGTDEVNIITEKTGRFTCICGYMTGGYPADVPAVFYITVAGKTYEAFTSCETEITGIGRNSGIPGFCLYIEGEVDASSVSVQVVFR